MKIPSRGIRILILFGVILLLGSALGARFMLDQPASGTTTSSASEPSTLGVVGVGYVDVQGGIAMLHPTQSGRVVSVLVKEGDEVKKGDLLLSLDNRAAKFRLQQAEADLAASKRQLQTAESQAIQNWKSEIEKQQAAVEAARQLLVAAEKELEIEQDSKQTSPKRWEIVEAKVNSQKSAVKIQEAALELIKNSSPQGTIDRAREDVKAKQAERDLAHLALSECDLFAPADGSILRLFAQPGEILASQPRQPAVQFCPSTPRIVRAEILQEFARGIRKGQVVKIEDDTRNGTTWKGKVDHVSDWFTQRRQVIIEPFQFNDVKTMECIVFVEPGSQPLRINQRVRVTIEQGGP